MQSVKEGYQAVLDALLEAETKELCAQRLTDGVLCCALGVYARKMYGDPFVEAMDLPYLVRRDVASINDAFGGTASGRYQYVVRRLREEVDKA